MRLSRLGRLASVDREELRFRLTGISRYALERAQYALARPQWDRRDLLCRLSPSAPAAVRRALEQRQWHEAHIAWGEHFATRQAVFPVGPAALAGLAATINDRFPSAAADAAIRCAKIAAGTYDILGYEDVPFGDPPDWHVDPVNRRRAPRRFWASVPYLDAACGDHKVVWEINRHQHWIELGRGRLLNSDRRCYTTFVGQLEHWLADNPPLTGINWASMLELGFRAVSWLWAVHLFAADAREDMPGDAPWTVDLLVALDRQLTHIERNLSRYFSPNTHLLGEALALYVAGYALPELAGSDRRVATGREILLAETRRQVLGDGGHAELSTHYHRYATDFYLLALLVARQAGDPARAEFEQTARRMAHYLRAIAPDNGIMPLIGDDDGGQLFAVGGRHPADASGTLAVAAAALDDARLATGSPSEEVLWLCGAAASTPRLGSRYSPASIAFPESGYYVLRNGSGDRVMLDAGRHGFLNGGHAHADALSLVLDLHGNPLFVDPGTGVYTIDPALRDCFRTTAMHNAVVLGGRPQAQPDGPFHWQSRVDASSTLWRAGTGHGYVEGTHFGYAPIRHTRGVIAIDGFGWVIIDHLIGEGRVSAEAFWHLDPAWSVALDDGIACLTHRSGRRTVVASTTGPIDVLRPGDPSGLTAFAPAYGRIVHTHVLTSRLTLDAPGSFATFVAADPALAADVRIRAQRTTPVDAHWHTFGFELSFPRGFATAVCAVERNPFAAAWPGSSWGTGGLRTNGRLAVAIRGEQSALRTFVIDGSEVEFAAPSQRSSAEVFDRLLA